MARTDGTFQITTRRKRSFWPRFYVAVAFRLATGRVPDWLAAWVVRSVEIKVEPYK